jgi:hypothetical protein
MTQPYSPTPFATPVINPAVGGAGAPIPYLSISQYKYAPTAMDTSDLVVSGTAADQDRALADTLRRASAWADRICFGADAAAKGASLAATLSVQVAQVPVLGRQLRLVCDYKPVIQVNGIDLGPSMNALAPLADPTGIRIGRRTIYVPLSAGIVGRDNGAFTFSTAGSSYAVVWSYVNGYPHTQLASAVTAGSSTVNVAATDGGTGLLGVLNGMRMTIVDGVDTETFVVASVSGTTITTATPLLYDHALPAAPDFLPVTSIPSDVEEAVILLSTVLIKTRGDNSLVLEELTAPEKEQDSGGDEFTDLKVAMSMLAPYQVRIKAGR